MSKRIGLFCAVVLTATLVDRAASGQDDCDTPLGEGDLRQLIGAGVPPVRIRQLIASCGVDFGQPDIAALETRLRQLGATAPVVSALFPPDGPASGASWSSPLDRRRMTFVAGGRFEMGSPETETGRDPDESAHAVVVANGFWMDVAEVTNTAFRRFVLSRPEWQKGGVRLDLADAQFLKGWDGNAPARGTDAEPVRWVSWHAARAYCAWAGKRLPTESEWEFAARGGTTTAFWWGETFDQGRVGMARSSSEQGTAPRTNPRGVIDLTGGVWEWTATVFAPYPLSPDHDDPRAPGRRSIRGGASLNAAAMLRVANRNSADPTATSETVGLRCVQ